MLQCTATITSRRASPLLVVALLIGFLTGGMRATDHRQPSFPHGSGIHGNGRGATSTSHSSSLSSSSSSSSSSSAAAAAAATALSDQNPLFVESWSEPWVGCRVGYFWGGGKAGSTTLATYLKRPGNVTGTARASAFAAAGKEICWALSGIGVLKSKTGAQCRLHEQLGQQRLGEELGAGWVLGAIGAGVAIAGDGGRSGLHSKMPPVCACCWFDVSRRGLYPDTCAPAAAEPQFTPRSTVRPCVSA